MTIIIFILILGLLVLVHEFGHFLAAKKHGILVEEFGFGLPPRIIGLKIGETIYSLNLFPVGGFVKLYGEEYQEVSTSVDPKLEKRAFAFKKPRQKASVIIAGVIGNFLLGWVLISFLFTQGVPVPTNKVIIEKVQPSSPAAKTGLKEKDIILKIKVPVKKSDQISPPSPIYQKEYPISSSTDFVKLTKKLAGQKVTFEVERNGQKIDVTITPRKKPPKNEGPLGIIITSYIVKKYPWYEAPFYGLFEAANITIQIIKELGKTVYQLITLQRPKVEVTGPIGIARYTSQAIKFGQNAVLELIALLSLNLAVINVLPFPALDGGRLTFVAYEWLTKRKVDKKLERNLNLIGIAILISLAIAIAINDIIKLYR